LRYSSTNNFILAAITPAFGRLALIGSTTRLAARFAGDFAAFLVGFSAVFLTAVPDLVFTLLRGFAFFVTMFGVVRSYLAQRSACDRSRRYCSPSERLFVASTRVLAVGSSV
jgi:hypothetical protein